MTGSACAPNVNFTGYTFLKPELINKNAAYAPFFVTWDDYYQRLYFQQDIQRQDNLNEWTERFCTMATLPETEEVVYDASIQELSALQSAAAAPEGKKPSLPYRLAGNPFATVIALNSCTEAVSYLIFTRKCEPYVTVTDQWEDNLRDAGAMQSLIQEGMSRFKQTRSHFIRLRYAYQVIRLAHYARQWQQTVDLYNKLIPQIDQKRPSIVFYWALGHLSGALQQLGKHPEAAYRYSLIFRWCPSKRAAAFRSFRIRDDADWQQAQRLCKSQGEQATLFIMRAGASRSFTLEDIQAVYDLDPGHPQLELLLVSAVQRLEQIFLRTPVTDQRYGVAVAKARREQAASFLVQLQQFVRRVIRDQKAANLPLWQTMVGYLELLAGDLYAADQSFKRAESLLSSTDYDDVLRQQIAVWNMLSDLLKFNPRDAYAEEQAFRIRSMAVFKSMPSFDLFLKDLTASRYAEAKSPGKAMIAAYGPSVLGLNPDPAVLDDLLKAAGESNPIFLERAMELDTNPDQLRSRLIELKGMHLFNMGQPEAALSIFRQMSETGRSQMAQFTPFRETLHDRINRPVTDSLLLNRQQIVEKIIEFEFQAKSASALGNKDAARLYYLIGLAYYNMSYFGHAWHAADYYRSGYNWLRLAQGPVFSLPNAPAGNRENIDVSRALAYFEKALTEAKDEEWAARAAFMAARCQQKQWFCQPGNRYRAGTKLIPVLPPTFNTYYTLLLSKYKETKFFQQAVKECKWLAAYAK